MAAIRTAAALAVLLCLAAAGLAARRAGAAWLAGRLTVDALKTALRWTPEDGSLHRRLGVALGSHDALDRAIGLNRRDALAWMESGLLYEAEGRMEDAERSLREAVRHSRRYVPRWTLANFYFRRGRAEEFWEGARQAAAITYIDPAPLYRLCWRMEPDGEIIRRRVTPEGRVALADFVTFLLQDGHIEGLREAAGALARRGDPADRERVLAACDRLIERGRWDQARELWRAAGGDAALVANGEFRAAPGGRGFDWRVLPAPGFEGALTVDGFRIALDGTQPETGVDLLRQAVILPSGTKWRLTAVTQGGGGEITDLYWRVTDGAGRERAASAPLPGEGVAAVEFAGEGEGWLTLAARRRSGHVRWRGEVMLRRVRIEAAERGEMR